MLHIRFYFISYELFSLVNLTRFYLLYIIELPYLLFAINKVDTIEVIGTVNINPMLPDKP